MLEIVIRETLSKARGTIRLHWQVQDPAAGEIPYRRSSRTFGNSLDCYEDLKKVVRRALLREGRIHGVPQRVATETLIMFLDPDGREHQGTRLTVGHWLGQAAASEEAAIGMM